MSDDRTEGQRKSDELFERMKQGFVRIVLDKPMGAVPAGAVFWTLPKKGE